jgi:2-polyprenyl-3-methyl-5-hydroxy-6-metoxy-1,4-benzoquinol methylase
MNPFASLAQRHLADEQMDAANLPIARYDAVLRDLARVNAVTMAARATLAFLDAVLARHRRDTPWRILDVGYGQGDMLRRIACWAERRGQRVALVGIDLNAASAASARAATPPDMAIDWRTGDYRALAAERWDIVLSSLVAHHMSDGERADFVTFMEGEAALGWMVNDLRRHRLAYLGYPWLARAMGVDPIVRADGQLSIARSFRRDEWRAMLSRAKLENAARIVRRFPFRLCVERIR